MDSEGVYENTTETQEEVVQAVPKKPRSEAQLAALESARKKAYAIRAEKAASRKQEEAEKAIAKIQAQKQPSAVDPKEDEDDEPEVIYRKKPPKKKKRVVVVQEESSSDSEIEVRLPKSKNVPLAAPKKTPDELRYEKAYNRLFSIDTL